MSTELIPAPPPELQREALTLVEQASALVIHDQESYDGAVEFTRIVKELQARAEAHHRPMIEAAHKAHKAGLAALASIQDPLVKAEFAVKRKVGAFLAEQQRVRRTAQAQEEADRQAAQLEQIRLESLARADAETAAAAINDAARRKAEEKQESDARLAEAQGATAAEVRAILEAPLDVAVVEPAPLLVEPSRYVPPPRMPPGVEKGKGVGLRETWTGEVVSMRELCAAIAKGKASPNLVTPNPVTINALARIERCVKLSVPGLRGVQATNIAIGGK